ncbi:MAG: ABC transporter ATP-binding protein [Alphaproteobacteria bacterium]
MSAVTLSKAIKKYGDIQVIHGVDLEINKGEFCVFVGPSGCGKSTLLRMIAGLEETTAGTISIDGKDVTKADPADRGIAMVFQSYALYPHMTVEENMGFGLKMNGVPKTEVKEKVAKAADILQLDAYLKRKPKALSGGQRQRVAIGRALVRGPEVFLFDEPLSNLDAELRVQMRLEIAKLHKELGTTMVYVTHDQVEAMTLADKIVVLRAGVVEQAGSPIELYKNPDNVFVAGFIGSPAMNFMGAKAGATDANGTQITLVDFGGTSFHKKFDGPAPKAGQELLVGVRPEHFSIDAPYKITTKVAVIENLGGTAFAYSDNKDGKGLTIEIDDLETCSEDANYTTGFTAERAYVFDRKSEAAIR